MGTSESNEDRLKAAGIIDPNKPLTPEQSAAIDSLSKKQVDDLISINEQLDNAVESDAKVIEMPGRIGPIGPQGAGKP